MASPSGLNDKVFGYCKIRWTIENFSLQTIKKKWSIESPEFTINGSERTNWYMNVRTKLINAENCVMFSLRRSEIDSSPKYIRLNLKLFSLFSEKLYECLIIEELSLKKGSEYETCLGSMEHLRSKITDQLDDSLTLICFMIVYSKIGNKVSVECNHAGLSLLCKNMLDLYTSTHSFDTKLLFVDNNIILAHRPILCARNEYLRSIFVDDDDNEIKEECISLPDRLKYKGMKKILPYLYTGDIRHVLEEPSFAVAECASFLGITAIKTHYEPDELFLRSTIDVQEYICILREYTFENSRLIWNFNAEKSTKTYQLLLCPKKAQKKEYTPLFTKTSDLPITTYLEFDFDDKSGHLFIAVSLVAIKDALIDIDDVIGRILKKRHCSHNVFEVVIKLKLTSGVKISCIDNCINVCVSYVHDDFHYGLFKDDMDYASEHELFSDILIHNRDRYFALHKCILAYRLQVFYDEDHLFADIDSRILSALLTYIYTGFQNEAVDDDEVIEVYKAAVLSRLPLLQSVCSEWLKLSIKTDRRIRCRVVRVTEEYQDAPLKTAILNHLFETKDTPVIPNRLFSLQDVHTCRYC